MLSRTSELKRLNFFYSCPIGLTGGSGEIMRVELYRIVNDDLVLVDYGVLAKVVDYAKQGYIIVIQYC